MCLILVIVATCLIVGLCKDEPIKKESAPIYEDRIELSSGEASKVESMVSVGIISFYAETNLVYCDEDYWFQLTRKERMDITILLGKFITNRLDGSIYWVNIYGMYTKKKLAVWSQSAGYKEYPFYDQQGRPSKLESFMLSSPFVVNLLYVKLPDQKTQIK